MAPGLVFDHSAVTDQTDTQYALKAAKLETQNEGPQLLDGPLAWKGSQYDEAQYTYCLKEEEKTEIEAALEHFQSLELDGHEVSQASFPLPTLRHTLSALAEDVHHGKGFVVIRGLVASARPIEDNIIIFLGLSSYIGEKRGKQDHQGKMLMHLRDAKAMATNQADRPARDSNLGLQFHADLWADILAMQVLSLGPKGGEHIIAPAYTIYNELSATRPDLLSLLMKPVWSFDPHSLHYTPEKRALIFSHRGHILFNFGRLHVFGDKDLKRPNLSVEQLEALEMVQSIAKKHQLRLKARSGDMTFVNNFAILHSREAFEDTKEQSRHLVRLWLKNESLAWRLPPVLNLGNQAVFYDDSVEENWEIIPEPRLEFELRDKF